MDDITTIFSFKIKQKLKRIGKTQKNLAQEINIDYSTLNKILNNKRELDYAIAVKIAQNLNLSLDKLSNTAVDQNYEELVMALDDLVNCFKNFNSK